MKLVCDDDMGYAVENIGRQSDSKDTATILPIISAFRRQPFILVGTLGKTEALFPSSLWISLEHLLPVARKGAHQSMCAEDANHLEPGNLSLVSSFKCQ
jgi:hypothetical protein